MSIFKFKNIKESSVYITPNFPVIETRRYKFSLFNILAVLGIYTFIIAVVVITVLAFTPAKDLIFIFENEKLTEQVDKVKELEGKIAFLSAQLEQMASTNEKLKYAIILGSVDTLDSTAAVYDSLKKVKQPNPGFGGNVMRPLLRLFFEDDQGDSIKNDRIFFISPVEGVVVKSFQPRSGHFGIDYGVKTNTPVNASVGGVVTFANYTSDDGYTIIIENDSGIITKYKHCASLLKKERDFVSQGELIALSGNSGYKTTGPHLHFEVWLNGKAIDPLKFIINP